MKVLLKVTGVSLAPYSELVEVMNIGDVEWVVPEPLQKGLIDGATIFVTQANPQGSLGWIKAAKYKNYVEKGIHILRRRKQELRVGGSHTNHF